MRALEPTATTEALPPVAEGNPHGAVGRDVIRRIAVTTFAIAAMTGVALMLIDLAIDRLSSLSFLRLSGLF
jgi:hypothetical protein